MGHRTIGSPEERSLTSGGGEGRAVVEAQGNLRMH